MCTLVAQRTGAVAEAAERGLSEPLLAEFLLNGHSGEQVIALTYCDLTTGPHGERLSPQQRQLLAQCHEVSAALTGHRGALAGRGLHRAGRSDPGADPAGLRPGTAR